MKINQFAQSHPDLSTIKKELQLVGFKTEQTDAKKLFYELLKQIQINITLINTDDILMIIQHI